jgi:hypothetical protein
MSSAGSREVLFVVFCQNVIKELGTDIYEATSNLAFLRLW